MKFRWWTSVFLLVASAFLFQAGCATGDLPMDSSADEAAGDSAMDTDMEMPAQ